MTSNDPLILLRASIASPHPPALTSNSDPADAASYLTDSFVDATHLYFASPVPQCLSLATVTRFTSTNPDTAQVDLRSIFFAWLKKDVTVPEYIASASELDSKLPDGQKIRNLVFVERIDLITWLEGASDESEYIKPFEGGADQFGDAVVKAAEVVGGNAVPTVSGTGVGVTQMAGGRPVKIIEARLQEIYNAERKIGDHNTVLRGIKPTDFSHVRKYSAMFLDKRRQPQPVRPGQPPKGVQLPSRASTMPQKPMASAVSSKRSDPIILLSPSASSLLRMSNVRSFLHDGVFVPPDHPTLSSQTTANLLHITRPLKPLSDRPFRFIIVDSPEQFKPDYWSRVVAVFTTGQQWQFRQYKWRDAQELFSHILGIYIGEKGAPIPNEVKGWGSNVKSYAVDRWDERAHGATIDEKTRKERRWRDQEVVEEVWRSLEGYMRGRGEWRR